MRGIVAIIAACVLGSHGALAAEQCPGNPRALGTSRVIAVDPAEHTRIGAMQYAQTLPLNDKEVVLTFDDGPLPPYTARILETLEQECAKATFFIVGGMARAYPEWVRRIYDAGHTVGSHSQNHPRFFWQLDDATARDEIDAGIVATQAALGTSRPLAPFFRFPGFGRTDVSERHLAARGIMTWGTDVTADDWKHIAPTQVVARALERLERKGKGVLMLHDIQPATALAVPALLRELKARGFRLVHVVPAGPERSKSVSDPAAWAVRRPRHSIWPVALAPRPQVSALLAAPSALSFGFPHVFGPCVTIPAADPAGLAMVIEQPLLMRAASPHGPADPDWPEFSETALPPLPVAAELPTVSVHATDLRGPLGSHLTIPQKAAATRATPTLERRTTSPTDSRLRSARLRHAPDRESAPSARWARSLNWFH